MSDRERPAEQSALHHVGVSVTRVDGAAKVSGSARYLDDIPAMPGELFGTTVRSQVARGRIRSVHFDSAFDWSDVTRVTAADVPENFVQLIVDDQPVLAAKHINHRYEPIVLLACADRAKLQRARDAVRIDVDELAPIFDVADALEVKECIWGEDNVQSRFLISKGLADTEDSQAGIAQALSNSEVVVSGSYSTHHQEQLYIEPHGMLAWWDDAGVHAIGSLQCPHYVHKAFKRTFGLPGEQIHISPSVTGGGFGGKEDYPSVIGLHAALLAQKSGQPVRLLYDRREDIEATTKRHPSRCDITTGCDRDGTMRALEMRVVFDAGAYVTLTPVVLSRGILHAGGAYRWQDARIEGLSVATNTPPNGAFRGFGAPQTIWAIERHLDRVARELGMDPGLLKRHNLLVEGDSTCTGQQLRGSVGGHACVEQVFAASDYLSRRQAGPTRQDRKVRGVGCSLFMHGAGFTGSGERMLKGKAAVDLLAGGRLRVRSGSTDLGQGAATVFAQIAADAAGVPIDAVEIATPTTTQVPDSGPTAASRTTMVVGSIVERAAKEVGRRVAEMRRPGERFEDAGDRLLSQHEQVSALFQYELPSWVQWDEERYKGDAYPVYGWMCDVAEVEVDLDTFEVQVLRFW